MQGIKVRQLKLFTRPLRTVKYMWFTEVLFKFNNWRSCLVLQMEYLNINFQNIFSQRGGKKSRLLKAQYRFGAVHVLYNAKITKFWPPSPLITHYNDQAYPPPTNVIQGDSKKITFLILRYFWHAFVFLLIIRYHSKAETLGFIMLYSAGDGE